MILLRRNAASLVRIPCMRAARRLALSGALGVGLAIALTSSPSRAEEPAKVSLTPGQIQAARDLFPAAMKDEDGERCSDALQKLQRVAQIKSTAGVRYHIALCEE